MTGTVYDETGLELVTPLFKKEGGRNTARGTHGNTDPLSSIDRLCGSVSAATCACRSVPWFTDSGRYQTAATGKAKGVKKVVVVFGQLATDTSL